MEYAEKWMKRPATDKQLDYLLFLCNTTHELFNPYLTVYESLLEIKRMHKKLPITNEQREYIENILTVEDLKEFGINSYEDITHGDLDKLIILNPKLNFNRIIDNFIPKKIEIPEKWTSDYEIGITISKHSENNEMKYIKFYDMMVLDYDHISLENVLMILKRMRFKYRIYKTFNGYHVFIISQKIPYNNPLMIEIGKNLIIDPWYIIYSKYYGYVVRTSPKINREETTTHAFIQEFDNRETKTETEPFFVECVKVFEDNINKPLT